MPDTLKSFVEILDKYGELDFIHGRMSYFSNEDPLLREQPAYINNEWQNGVVSGKQLFANAFKFQGSLAMGVRGLYNREFLIKNKLLFVERKQSWPEDEEWTPRVFAHARRAAGNEKPYYCYRENREGSETTKLLNLQTGLITLKIYKEWEELVDICENNVQFNYYIRKEAGRRFIWCISKNSIGLSDDDFRIFISEANHFTIPYDTNKLSRKDFLLKWMIRIMGVKKGGGCFRALAFLRRHCKV